MKLKYQVGQKVRVEGDNDVWDGTIATITGIDTSNPEFPYRILVHSSPRAFTEGESFNWNESTLVPMEHPLALRIEANFPHRIDVYYSNTTGGAVILTGSGMYRMLSNGYVEKYTE